MAEVPSHHEGKLIRESFLKLLHGEKPEAIAWAADLAYWVDGRVQAGDGNPRWREEIGYLELCRELGCLPYYWYDKFWVGEPRYDGVEMSVETRGRHQRRMWKTKVGTLSEESVFLEGSWSQAPLRYPVQTEGDLDVLLQVLEHRRLEASNLADYHERLALWASYDGVPCLGLPRSPLPSFLTEWAGVEQGALLLMDHPDKLAQVLRLMEQQEAPIIDAVCELAPPVVHFPDNLSSDNLTSFFGEHMAARYRRRIDRLHAAGVCCAVHLDGAVRGLLPRLAAVGFDAVEAVTPKPVGDVGLQEMRAVAGDARVVLWGGVPGAMFAPPFSWEDVRRHVELLLECWGGTPFIVGVADQVPPNGEIEFVRRISQLLEARRP